MPLIGADLQLRMEIETFLYADAELLDAWELERWLELFDEDATYQVPGTGNPEGDPRTQLFLLTDDYTTLRSRVTRLMSKSAYAEQPRSRTRRLVTNVRVVSDEGELVRARADFLIVRAKWGETDTLVGEYHLVLRRHDHGFHFVERRAVLDNESLRPIGKIAIIV